MSDSAAAEMPDTPTGRLLTPTEMLAIMEAAVAPGTPTARLVAALHDPERLFTPVEVLYLMRTSGRWAREDRDGEPDPLSYRAGVNAGYLQRLAEENAAAHAVIFDLATSAAHDAVQVHRKRMGVDRRYQRAADHLGGPVPEW